MTTNTFALDLQRPFNLRMTVESHGWCQLAPWHWDGESLERTVRIGTNAEWPRAIGRRVQTGIQSQNRRYGDRSIAAG
jgi:hypothetical protein